MRRLIVLAAALLLAPASARWKAEYAQLPQATQDWYQQAELTEAAKHRFPFTKCCAQSDVVKTKFKVGGVGQDEWWWLHGDKWERVPDDIIHWNEHAPGGQPVLFVFMDQPTCFFPPDGGI